MKYTSLFEEFVNEATSTTVEVARSKSGKLLMKAFGKFVGQVSCDEVYYKDKNEERNEEIANLFLEKFPASEEWKMECEKHANDECFGLMNRDKAKNEKVEIAVAKEPGMPGGKRWGNHIGPIQLWDESKMSHSMSFPAPFGNVNHSVSGTYVGGVFFAENSNLSKLEVEKIVKAVKAAFPDKLKSKRWVEGN